MDWPKGVDQKRIALALTALFAGGFVPIHAIVLSFGYAQYFRGVAMGPRVMQVAHEFATPYVLFLYVPSLIALAGITLHARRHYPDVFRRIVVGLCAGAIATIGLDWIRQMGVIRGWLPGDTPEMFGKAITGSAEFAKYYWIGQASHFMNGADFGLCFTFFFGNFPSYRKTALFGVAWLLVMEFFMMIGPPMGPMVGLFGTNWLWPQLFVLTFIAHVVHGTILGMLVHLWLTKDDEKWLIPFLLDSRRG